MTTTIHFHATGYQGDAQGADLTNLLNYLELSDFKLQYKDIQNGSSAIIMCVFKDHTEACELGSPGNRDVGNLQQRMQRTCTCIVYSL